MCFLWIRFFWSFVKYTSATESPVADPGIDICSGGGGGSITLRLFVPEDSGHLF